MEGVIFASLDASFTISNSTIEWKVVEKQYTWCSLLRLGQFYYRMEGEAIEDDAVERVTLRNSTIEWKG